MIDYLTSHYSLRYNDVNHCTEYRSAGSASEYLPLDLRKANSMAIEVRTNGIDATFNEVRCFLNSDHIRHFNPIHDYLAQCEGTWDGTDHIGKLADCVSTSAPLWRKWFTTWFLAMVAQWRDSPTRSYGNSTAPLLISPQGYNKSTFCRNILPPELSWGYTDGLLMEEKKQVMQAMAQMLLINLDEFNQISTNVQQGFLKNIIQMPSIKMKRPYGRAIEELPRIASFIATSNMTDILSDPSGNRRFIGIELTHPIDVSSPIDHRQLYAQALQMLHNGQKHWFDMSETQRIMQWNRRYEIQVPTEQYFHMYFEPAANEAEGLYLSAAEIYDRMKSHIGSGLKINSLQGFGRRLSNMPQLQHRHFMSGTKYLVRPLHKQ